MTATTQLAPPRSYTQVKRELCHRLLNATPEQHRLPPIKSLARELRASQVLTHQAVKELVHDGLLISRPKVGTFINQDAADVRHKLEQVVKTDEKTMTVGPFAGRRVIILTGADSSPVTDAFYTRTTEPFVQEAETLGVDVQQHEYDTSSPLHLDEYSDADAFVIINPNQNIPLKCSKNKFMFVVSTTEHCTIDMDERVDLVCVDDHQAGRVAGRWLRKQGLTDVCFLGVRHNQTETPLDKTSMSRLVGFQEGLGNELPPERLLVCSSYTTVHGARAVSDWISRNPRPSTIFAVSDDVAFGFIHGAEAHNLRAGRDYQIIGFDGQQESPDPHWGKLTTVAVPMHHIGIQVGKLLEERMREPSMPSRRICMGCSIIEGTTTTANS